MEAWMQRLRGFAAVEGDSEDITSEKVAALIVAGACTAAGVLWTLMYFVVFGWGLTTALPAGFVLAVGLALVISHVTGNHRIVVVAQIVCIMGITTAIQLSIGGLADSGFVMAWALIGPLTALLFFPVRRAVPWILLYVALLLVMVFADGRLGGTGPDVSEGVRTFFFATNLSVSALVLFAFAGYFVGTAVEERARANELLLNVLPKEVAPLLKAGHGVIAEEYPSASVMFADIVGSTPLFAELEPAEAVDWLNEVFTEFDALVEERGLEKIRTIGDNYMVAAGVPTPRSDHAEVLVDLGLAILEVVDRIPGREGHSLQFRVGINSGPMVGGVIGTTKFHYDVWGDAVNCAARMESQGAPGRVQIAEGTHRLVRDRFMCVPRGEIEVRGRGPMPTWWVEARA
ncbi:MAG: adenylate/guanylate cyclase domain-containing protein [Acidimicrobiia bacterium]|nr:adenylate/guanylate cyclase domain-containing protein [Acidimicrobiia bacterium]